MGRRNVLIIDDSPFSRNWAPIGGVATASTTTSAARATKGFACPRRLSDGILFLLLSHRSYFVIEAKKNCRRV